MGSRFTASRGGCLAATTFLLLVAGCSHLKTSVMRSLTETTTGAPSKLDASPETSGLLLVDSEVVLKGVWFGKTRYRVTGAWIEKADADGRSFYSASFDRGLVVFQGLEPGTYRLMTLKSWHANGYLTVQLEPDSRLTAAVTPGVPAYLGHLIVVRKGNKVALEWKRDPPVESAAWRRLRKEYVETPWAVSIDTRIQALE